MSDLFKDIGGEFRATDINPRSESSRTWFLNKVKSLGDANVGRDRMLRRPPLEQVPTALPGKMYMFWYNAKHSETLPFYDKFPLIILMDTAPGGMVGLNLHYLPISLRQTFFYGLLNRVNNTKYDDSTYLKVTYDYLKATRSAKAFRPCFKRYLTSHIRGQIVNVPASEWELAIHLPTSLFQNETEQEVHRHSKEMIGKY